MSKNVPTFTREPARARSRLVPIVLGVQAAALGVTAIAVFGGIGIGSTALRLGVGILFVILAASAAGIAISYSEGQPAARTATLVFEGFALALALLWFAPIPAMVGCALAALVLALAARRETAPGAQIRRPVPSQ
jgi:hypothetical protein